MVTNQDKDLLARRRFNTQLLAGLGVAVLPLPLWAADADSLQEGRDWRRLSPPPARAPSEQIEVLKFFSYGCGHCARLNPLIEPWAKEQPADVSFQRVPVTFGRAAWASLARLHFALEFAGELERLDQAVFDAVTQQRENLYTERDVLRWVKKQGVDDKAFADTMNSFAVETALARAATLEQRMGIDAVPRIVIDNQYVVVGQGATDYGQLLVIADQLIERVRQARG